MPRRFASIQYLRIVAAMLVVTHHACNPHPWLYDALPVFTLAQPSVDLFFVMSGFIMYWSAKDEAPLDFLHRRLTRVVPLYWLATLVTAPMIVINHHEAVDGRLALHLLQSLLLIPHLSLEHPGKVWPLLVVGWTLSYEMFFYLVFAVGLAVRRVVVVLSATVVTLVIAGLLIHVDAPFWVTFTDPRLLDFLAGVALGVVGGRLGVWNLAVLAPLGLAGILLDSTVIHLPEVIGLGVPTAAVVAGVASLELRGGLWRSKALDLLGKASFCIYLVQVLCIGVVGLVVQRLPVHGPPQFALMLLMCLATSIGAGVATHLLLERRLLQRLPGPDRKRPGRLAEAPILSAGAPLAT